jgi:hypothetical protein
MGAAAKRRSRYRPQKTTGIVKHTIQDAVGFCEPLCRYGQLPTEILGAFYNLANGNAVTSLTYKDRLTRLIQESEGFTASRKILYRPDYQRRFGINQQAIYRKTIGTVVNLYRFGVYDDLAIRWANTAQVMQYEAECEPSDHDQELSIVAASIEIEMRRHLKFASHIDILKTASPEAQNDHSPLSIPIPKLSHRFPTESRPTVITDTYVKPDFLCGAGYPADIWKFYTLEYDRSNETSEPTKSLTRQSMLRKILAYSAISAGKHPIYETYLRVPNLLALFVFQSRSREAHFHQLVKKYATYPSQFLTKVVPPFDPVMNPDLMPHLFNEPWLRADGSVFSIANGK